MQYLLNINIPGNAEYLCEVSNIGIYSYNGNIEVGPNYTYKVNIAPTLGTIVVGLLNRQFFDTFALQLVNAHAVVAGVRRV